MDRPNGKETLRVLLMMGSVIAGLSIVFFAFSSSPVFQRDPVSPFSDDDVDMTSVMARARETLPQFIEALTNPKPNQSQFALKLAFHDGDRIEHMFIQSLTYRDGKFSGRLVNTPQHVRNIIEGQTVEATAADVSDWLYVEDGKMVGGDTIRLQLARYGPQERALLRLRYPYVIDDLESTTDQSAQEQH